ncbi:Uncharacterised protein [Salmonella enterica subsp. enterica serovar Bovismorbificans]|nr:Uncharacterised protein [Salmonella enterica subsp. enterica serovar Bovismorbificans]CNU46886.1 Uncharacterised protein [Salmonella enterica subsp. enterica serovar Bovismorbificans]CQB62124.1 Uncharacterised protein [Salmonella enterica subsp. enterica serovar Bovismorbificans]
MDVAIHDAYRDLRTGRPCYYRPARPSPCFRANGACLRPAGAHDGAYARSIGTDLSGEVLRGGVARNALARWSVAADGAGTHRRRYLAGDAGRNHAGATGDRADRPAVLWRLVGNEWAHRSGNLRCVREFSRYADRPYPRTGIVFGYRTAHTGVGRARLRAYRHAFSHGRRY